MIPDQIEQLLQQRDELIAMSPELSESAVFHEIENAEIRELGKIVLETTAEELAVFSTT